MFGFTKLNIILGLTFLGQISYSSFFFLHMFTVYVIIFKNLQVVFIGIKYFYINFNPPSTWQLKVFMKFKYYVICLLHICNDVILGICHRNWCIFIFLIIMNVSVRFVNWLDLEKSCLLGLTIPTKTCDRE